MPGCSPGIPGGHLFVDTLERCGTQGLHRCQCGATCWLPVVWEAVLEGQNGRKGNLVFGMKPGRAADPGSTPTPGDHRAGGRERVAQGDDFEMETLRVLDEAQAELLTGVSGDRAGQLKAEIAAYKEALAGFRRRKSNLVFGGQRPTGKRGGPLRPG